MAITKEHDLHRRRLGRNVGVALSLGAFIVLVMALTVVKMKNGASMEAYDHQTRISITEPAE